MTFRNSETPWRAYATACERLDKLLRDFAPAAIDKTLAAIRVGVPVASDHLSDTARAFDDYLRADARAYAGRVVVAALADVVTKRDALRDALAEDKVDAESAVRNLKLDEPKGGDNVVR